MMTIPSPRKLTRVMGLAGVLVTGFMFASLAPVQADPPGHAKAHGWRNKNNKKAKKHVHTRACREEYNAGYGSRYDDDYRWEQEQRRRDAERRRWEEEQRRRDRYNDDRYYDDRYGRSGNDLGGLADIFLGGGRGGDLGGLLGGGRGGGLGDLGGLLGGLRIRK